MRALLLIPLLMLFGDGSKKVDIRWYNGPGPRTANGETFNVNGYTYASKTHPFGTVVDIVWHDHKLRARCNDRGPNEVELTLGAFFQFAEPDIGVLRDATITKIK